MLIILYSVGFALRVFHITHAKYNMLCLSRWRCKSLKVRVTPEKLNKYEMKLAMWLETDVGSEVPVPLTLFNVIHPAMAAVIVSVTMLTCFDNQLHTPTSERQRLSKKETA